MKRWTKALVTAAFIALPLAAADYAAADDRPRYGGPGFGVSVGSCQGACYDSREIYRDRAQARADFRELRRDRARGAGWRELRADRFRLRADLRELRHDRREARHDRRCERRDACRNWYDRH